ncbi:MAG: ATP-dependent metallopeptidase FtsH/Yme1/Tma family protein, partial [Gemmatimonadota bacterium]
MPTPRPGSRRPRRPTGPVRPPQKRPRLTGLSKSLALWLLIILLPLTIYQLFMPRDQAKMDIKYSEFADQLEAGNVAAVTITEKQLSGTLERPARAIAATGRDRTERPYTEFRTVLPFEDPELVQRMQEDGVAVEARQAPINWFTQVLSWLPWILIIAFWIFFVRQIQGGGSKAFSFGKSKAKLLAPDAPKVTFEDVAGADEAKGELEEIIEFLRDPKKFQRLGGRIPKGVLLLGPPGTGKTLLARAVAGEASVPFFQMSGSDFVEMFVGVGASVTGDTPVLVRTGTGTELVPIGEFADRFYPSGDEGYAVPVAGVETLGYAKRPSGFRGRLDGFGGSAWQPVQAVYRHRVEEIFEIRYLGGTLRTTGDHSVFVRGHGGIKPKAARDLRPGDVLVALPFKTRRGFDPVRGTLHEVRAHAFSQVEAGQLAIQEPNEEVAAAYEYICVSEGWMTQSELGRRFGVSQATIGNWQSGKHEPRAISSRYTTTAYPDRVTLTPD